VVHWANEAARTALLLLFAALPLERVVAGLMGVAVTVSAAIVAVAATVLAAGDVAGVLGRALAVAIAELLLPALAAGIVLLAISGLKVLGGCLGSWLAP
jgi:hypothetical protein